MNFSFKIKEQEALKLINAGKLDKAEELYRELIQLGTRNHITFGNLAALCGRKGNQIEMIQFLHKAIQLNKDYPDAHCNLGNALQEQGNLKSAIKSYKQAIILKPDFAEAHYNLGNALQALGELKTAASSFRKAINLKPDFAEAHYNLGNALQALGELNSAITSYQKALKFKPSSAEILNNLGGSLQEKGHLNTALIFIKEALQIDPDLAKAHNNLGIIRKSQGDLKTAISCFQKAIQLEPNYAPAHNNLGLALQEGGHYKAAITSYEQALKLKPFYIEVYINLGNALQALGELKRAISSFQKAINLQPNFAEAHWNLSLAQLLCGNYEVGWDNYEWRWKTKEAIKPNTPPHLQRWQKESLKSGEKLLIVSEQGLGDTIQHMRYISHLCKQGIKVSFAAQIELHGLIKESKIHSSPITTAEVNLVFDGKWIPLLSLPGYLGVNPNNPIIAKPYLSTPVALIRKWANILSKEEGPIIGINWQGNPNSEKNSLRGRSIPLENFSPIAESNDVRFLSLQKGFGTEQLDQCSFREKFVDCQKEIDTVWDFLETAAIIANCDLIITSDTSVAHLSGGMGQTTWVLLKDIPDWRWGLKSQATFWYPSMKLFRQKERHNWHNLMENCIQALIVDPII